MSTEKPSSDNKFIYPGDQLRLLYPHPWAGHVVRMLFAEAWGNKRMRVQCIDAPSNECFITPGLDNFERVEVPHVL